MRLYTRVGSVPFVGACSHTIKYIERRSTDVARVFRNLIAPHPSSWALAAGKVFLDCSISVPLYSAAYFVFMGILADGETPPSAHPSCPIMPRLATLTFLLPLRQVRRGTWWQVA